MATIFPTSVPTKRLSQSISASALTFRLSDIEGWDGTDLTSASFGTKGYGVFRDENNTNVEFFQWDPSTIASGDITILLRGLKFTGDLTTEVTANKRTWVKGTLVELGTHVPQLIQHYVKIIGSPQIQELLQYATELIPLDNKDLASKKYVDDTVNGGAVSNNRIVVSGTAGETLVSGNLVYFKPADGYWWKCDADTITLVEDVILGIAQGAGSAAGAITGGVLMYGLDSTQTARTTGALQYASNTAGGISETVGTNARVVGRAVTATTIIFDPNFFNAASKQQIQAGSLIYAADSVGTDSYAITLAPAITAYTTGMMLNFKAGTANTGACTLAVNGLTAKTIKKNVSDDLETGDIASTKIVTVIYDGTYFQMVNAGIASTTAKGVVETATAVEVEAGTDTGGTGAPLVAPPSTIGVRHAVGAMSNAVAKLYYNVHLLFTLWTGSTSGAATTDFANWERNSSSVTVIPLGSMCLFTSTGSLTMTLNPIFYPGAVATALDYGSHTNTIILDFWYKYVSGTGEAQMGFFSGPSGVYGDNATGVGFHVANGVLYALTQKADPNGAEARTDISSGITLTNWNNLRVEYDMGTSSNQARFYVNGTLKQTRTGTGQPSDTLPVAGTTVIGFGRNTTNPVLMGVTAPYFSIEMNP